MELLKLSALAILLFLYSCGGKQSTKPEFSAGKEEYTQEPVGRTGRSKDSCYRVLSEFDERPLGFINKILAEELDSAEVYDNRIIYGFWFKPHEATVNILFHKDGTFVYRDYDVVNDRAIEFERKGTFEMKSDSVHMFCPDGWHLALHYAINSPDCNDLSRWEGDVLTHFFVKGSE